MPIRRPRYTRVKNPIYIFWSKEPVISTIRNSSSFRLKEAFKFHVVFRGEDHVFVIRPGFVYDGASIPIPFKNAIGGAMDGSYRTPALIHDALYAAEVYSRKVCDLIFLVAMRDEDVPWWKRNCMYFAVRAGGYFVWADHTETSVAATRTFLRTRIFDGAKATMPHDF